MNAGLTGSFSVIYFPGNNLLAHTKLTHIITNVLPLLSHAIDVGVRTWLLIYTMGSWEWLRRQISNSLVKISNLLPVPLGAMREISDLVREYTSSRSASQPDFHTRLAR